MGGPSPTPNPCHRGHVETHAYTYCPPLYPHAPPRPITVIRTWAKENGETGFPISPLRTHLRQAFVALAAGRGWPQPPKGPRVTNGLRDPRSLPPSSGHVRSMRMDLSHRTPAPVSRHHSPLERGCGASAKTTSRDTPEAHQQLSPPRGTLRHLSPPDVFRFRGHQAS
jgi:hypothetical protein